MIAFITDDLSSVFCILHAVFFTFEQKIQVFTCYVKVIYHLITNNLFIGVSIYIQIHF